MQPIELKECIVPPMKDLNSLHYIRGHSITTWTRRGGEGPKLAIFVHVQYIKNVHGGRYLGGQERAKLMSMNDPLVLTKSMVAL